MRFPFNIHEKNHAKNDGEVSLKKTKILKEQNLAHARWRDDGVSSARTSTKILFKNTTRNPRTFLTFSSLYSYSYSYS